MTNRWIGWSLAAVAFAVSTSAAPACDKHAAADVKDAKVVAANGDVKGCDMPCCAHAKAAAGEVKAAVAAPDDKPCAGHAAKGCPKKAATATALAKAEPAKDAAKPEPAPDPGTHR